MKIIPVILSGGSGTRLWPLSRSAYPKQLLSLVSEKTMLQETLLRLDKWEIVERPIIVCGNDHRFIVAEQLRAINIDPKVIILEPEGRNTAPAIAAASMLLNSDPDSDSDSVMLILPADHVIKDVKAFERIVMAAIDHAKNNKLVTFGITPSSADTGYGYIQLGKVISGFDSSFEIKRFVEKPDLKTAKNYLQSEKYFWNSGMFLFKPSVFIEELLKYEPKMVTQVQLAIDNSYNDLEFLRLSEKDFKECPSNSIDYAVMEKTEHGIIVRTEIGWSDIGSWEALSSISTKDKNGNTLQGDTFALDTKNTFIRSESRLVATLGIKDLVIVDTQDALLISNKKNTQDVKKIISHIKSEKRTEHDEHKKVFRPWGHYESLILADNFQVKSIIIKPGSKLSLQMHTKRAEHWVVVSGVASVTIDDNEITLYENQSTYIPIASKHRLANTGKKLLHIIEIQSGAYLGEDDIVRFDDAYGRT